jgi:FkbM family methyltransferase
MRFFQHYLRPGDAFLDVGANEGIYTLLAASRLGKSGSIDSFEPNPGPLARLRENIALNGLDAVRVHPVAVGAEPGTVRFMLDDQRSHIDAASEHGESAEVSMVRLDDELSGRRYAAGKMDIEGAEPLAMRGAERMLSEANPPVWLLEVQGHVARYGLSEEEFFDWLAAHGYDLATYDSEARRLCYLDRAPAKGAADRGRPANVLAIARASRPDVEARVRA